MKRIKPVLVLTVLLVAAMGFTVAKQWFLLESKSFSIEFPQKPDKSTQTIKSEIGDLKMEMAMYDASAIENAENLTYSVAATDYPNSVINSDKTEMLETFFRNSTDGAVNSTGGKLLTEKTIEIDGFPGREVRIDFKEGLAVITQCNYLVKNKLYTLQIITETAKDSNASAKRFFASFKLKK